MAKRRTATRTLSLAPRIISAPAPRVEILPMPVGRGSLSPRGRGGGKRRRSGGGGGGKLARVAGLAVGGALGRSLSGVLQGAGLSPTMSRLGVVVGGYLLAGRSGGGLAGHVGDGAIATAGADLLGQGLSSIGAAAQAARQGG